jgi:arginyl-tRNA synthetase
MKELITSLISDAVARARLSGDLASDQAPFTVERPGDSSHGDMATNAALVMAKAERKAPRAVAEIIPYGSQLLA